MSSLSDPHGRQPPAHSGGDAAWPPPSAWNEAPPGAAALPIDSDVGVRAEARTGLPPHFRPAFILVVGIGGASGALARYGVSLIVPPVWQLPWPTLTVNLLGALLLGMLMEGLARRGDDTGRRRILRLLLGTGFLGGFTTFSSLAVETQQLLGDGRIGAGIGYAAVTVVVGLFASFAGIWLAAAAHRRTSNRQERLGAPS